MCGKDGTQRGVYKLKEEHEKGGLRRKKERKKNKKRKVERKKGEEKKGFVLVTREKYPGYQLKNLERS